MKNFYDEVILGKSYVSLIFAILQKAKGLGSNLVVDDSRLEIGDKWSNYIGELEKKAIASLGRKYGIGCLERFEQFIVPSNTMIFLNERMIELGSSPFANIKELARKLPECFSPKFIQDLTRIDSEKFDREVDEFYDRLVEKVLSKSNGDVGFPTSPSGQLEPLFQFFDQQMKDGSLINKQLHYILQALYQTVLSNILGENEIRFLLASILSPAYMVDAKRLEDELTFVYKTMGGDTKKADVQELEIYKERLEYLLLDSYEGVVRTNNLSLFGHFGKNLPFDYEPGKTVYHSIIAKCPLKDDLVARFKNKRILFSFSDRMGTDFPHWEIRIDEKNLMHATYVYAEYEGSKPSFYFKNASDDLFKSLKSLFPALKENDWVSQVDFCQGKDVWLDNSKRAPSSKGLKQDSRLGSEALYEGSPVKGVKYCGPLRARQMGFFGYIVGILDS